MKYTTILPAFLFLAGSALLPISGYADHCNGDNSSVSDVSQDPVVEGNDEGNDGDVGEVDVDEAGEVDSSVNDEDGSDG